MFLWRDENTRMGSKVMPMALFTAAVNASTKFKPCTCSPLSDLSKDVQTKHVDTISRSEVTFAQTLLVGY